MTLDTEKLYNMLPAVYRERDAEQGLVLRQLVQVIAEQVAALEEDIEQLYDDQFIETCAEWVIPYIGDLIGYRGLYSINPQIRSQRAEVANTIGYRRKKGTAGIIEDMARDITEYGVLVVEFFRRLATTQYLNHLRPEHMVTVDLRKRDLLADIGTPFDRFPRTLEVRCIETDGGRYNIPNVGIFLWRTESFKISEAHASRVDARRYRFSPLGADIMLFNHPKDEGAIKESLPSPLLRNYLAENLNSYYGSGLSLLVSRGDAAIPLEEVTICDLSDKDGGWANMPAAGTVIDPELGRIAFSEDIDDTKENIVVDFCYGFTAEMGGGPYDRSKTLPAEGQEEKKLAEESGDIKEKLGVVNGSGIVEVQGSGPFRETFTLAVAKDSQLSLIAADESRPTVWLEDECFIVGGESGEVVLNGLLITGAGLRVKSAANYLQRLRLQHCTLVPGITLNPDGSPQSPGKPSLTVELPTVEVVIEDCIVGTLKIENTCNVHICNSIIDASLANDMNIDDVIAFTGINDDEPGGKLHIRNSTVIGKVFTEKMTEASNCLFLGHVEVRRIQEGCVRFSYIPPGSRVPRPYRCVPLTSGDEERVYPKFTSLRYGHPGYCQLRSGRSPEIRRGADDRSEMGAFHDLYQQQREDSLRIRLNEYLPFGLKEGIFYES